MASETAAVKVETAAERQARELAELKRQIGEERAALDAGSGADAVKAARRELAKVREERAERELREAIETKTGGEFGKSLALVKTPGGPIVLERKLPILFHRFTAKKVTRESTEEFVRALVIHPSPDEAAELFETYPGAMTVAADCGITLYGFRNKDVAGKS